MATSLNPKVLELLLKRAEETHSDAVVVMHRGETIGVWRFGKPKQLIQTMSITKSIVNLAVGKLITDGLLSSIDEPVCSFYPEWKQGRKKDITIKHIMNHMSGLQNVPTTDVEIYPSSDFVQLALCAELVNDPGTEFSYNNKATNLLPGVVQKICGQKLDDFMAKKIFTPIGIETFEWQRDKVGNPHGMAGLALFPEDLAKLGQFVLNRGLWGEQQIIDASWFDLIESQPFERVGLLWWIERDSTFQLSQEHITNLRSAKAPEEIVEKLEQIQGVYTSQTNFVRALQSVFGAAWPEEQKRLPKNIKKFDVTHHGISICQATGFLGQYLWIFPQRQLIFVRMITGESFQSDKDNFSDFPEITSRIAKLL
jgi:CubicO group peptidase (beta-lactamase class C family)